MSTFSFTALLEADLLQGVNGNSIGTGDVFVMPTNATVEMIVTDNDDALSGDRYNNEYGDDQSGQTADIIIEDQMVFDDARIYSECYHILEGSDGKTYYMIEIEIAGSDNAPGQGDDFFTFYGDTPPAGVELSVVNTRNVRCDWVEYDELDAGQIMQVIVEAPENNAPVAADDAFVTDELTTVSGNVLSNDSDPDGDVITVTGVQGGTVGEAFEVTTSQGHTGMVTLQADGTFTFDPDESFEALAQDEQDSFELTYTISDDPTAATKHNLMFVLDVSNSTVGTSGNNVFDGTGVGDMNNDGVSNTVLDAEIQAVISAVESLIAQGVDPANIDIGIATFSGIASGFASVDAETLGTFALDDGNLMETLLGIQSGGWTNYEAGLQQAEDWFASQAGDGAQNKLMFLSDGRPIVGYDYSQGQYITQTNADYGDEVSRIANDHGAEIYGIGIGANSDLDYLNDLDNTGGAERVLDASTLNVVVENAVATPASSTATITVTINGLNEGPEALNDALTVDEDEMGSVNILGNDSDPDGDAISITDIGGHAVGEEFSVTTAAGHTGTVTVQADGTLVFDPGAGFEDMNDTDTDSFELTYTITDGQFTDTATVTVTVNGKGQPVDANDDAYSINEDQDVAANVLGNDTPNDGSLTVVAVAEDGNAMEVGASFEVTTDSGRTGTVTLAEDGSFTFDGGDNFIEMAAGEVDTFDLTYTVEGEAKAGDVPKHNILFVIDVSGSTSPAEFGGSAVGDQNGDGVENTVLDAEIAALKALSQQIADSGLTADKVDIGLVAFSGNSSGSNQNGASQFLGTFNAGDAALENALEGLTDGGWTNFEAPLQSGIAWFEDQAATTDDNNIVYFLSDGYQNVGGAFDDEAAELASRFGAEMNAVGVGTGSSLEQLNIIDNTGGAEIVTTTDDLTAALIADAPEIPGDQDTATITVTINGLNEGPEALNDALTVDEDEMGSVNILGNDSDPDGDAISITDIGGHSVGEEFSVTTAAGHTGTVTVQADGTLAFDPGAGFEDMNDTDTDSFELTYTITDGQFTDTATVTVTVNGKGQPVDANDDAFSISEEEDIAANVLDNDTPNDGSLTVVAVAEDGTSMEVGASFAVTTDGDRTGTVTLAEDGSFTFDGGDNFIEMAEGEVDTFDLTYTVEGEAKAGDVPKHNILFVIDVSGSTSPAEFGGSAVGDQNGDGVANTVLDAEIAALKALSQQIADSGLTADKVDIGLVAFSGNSSGSNQNGASQFLGTFNAGDASLENALEGLTDGGWTNFEAPLQSGIAWFEDQAATTDDKNIVYFLSDGYQNVGGTFDDEAAELASRFGAEMNAVGVGTGSSLEQLNVIDNTGGAEIVTTTDDLTAALIADAPEIPGDRDTATITVTINGVNDLSDEDEATTVEEDAGFIALTNVLDNTVDPEAGDPPAVSISLASLASPSTSGSGGPVVVSVGQATNGGVFNIDANGVASFDTNGEFDHLNEGESAITSVDYTVRDAAGAEVTSTYTVTVMGTDSAPVAIDDALVTDENTETSINVLTNDMDPEDDPLTVTSIEGGSVGTPMSVTTASGRSGTVTVLEDGTFTFNPGSGFEDMAAGETDTVTLDYTASDGVSEDSATVTITVNGLNDLSDEGESATVSEDSGVTALDNVLDNAVDPEAGDPVVVSVGPSTGGGVFSIDADGTASFDTNGDFEALAAGETAISTVEYTIEDAAGDQVTSTYSVTIEGVNDLSDEGESATVSEDSGVTALDNVLDNAVDPEAGDPTVVSVGPSTGGGVFSIDPDGTASFDTNGDFEALAAGETAISTVEYTIEDAAGDQVTSTYSVTIEGVNDLSDEGETATVSEDSGVTALDNVLDNAVDPEAGDPTVVSVGPSTGGGVFSIAADGTASFDTNGDFEALAAGETAISTVEYTIEDAAGDQVTSTYSVTIEGVNDLSDEGESATVSEDSGVTALDNVLDNAVDPEAGDPTVVSVGPSTGGGVFSIDPDGTASFDTNGDFEALAAGETAISTVEYTIEDAAGDQVTSTYSVTIEGVNDLSDEGETATVSEDSGVTALDNVLDNAVDPEAGDPTVVSVGPSTGGGVFSIDADGTASFDTNGDFEALAAGETAISTVEYTIEDAAGDQVTSTYSVTIEGVNDLSDEGESATVSEDSGVTALDNVLDNAVDPEAGDPTVVSVGPSTGGGVFSIDADGTASFDTDGDFEALAAGETAISTVEYTIEDAAGDQVTSTYSVTIEGVNDLSDEGETATVSEDSGVTALDNVLDNAVDPEAGDPVVVSVGTATNGGVFSIAADGTASFDTNGEFDHLAEGETAVTTVDYTIEDAAGDQVTSTYSVTVEGVANSGGRVSFNGSISTRFDGTTHVVAIIETSQFTTGVAWADPVGDMDGDGNYGTMIDGLISAVFDLAETLAPTDKISLIPSGFDGMGGDIAQAFTFDAGELVAARGNTELVHNMLREFKDTYGMDFMIDLPQSLTMAQDVLFGSGVETADQNEVVVLTASPAHDPFGADMAAASLAGAGADIDVVYVEAGQFAASMWLDSIDTDGMAQYIDNPLNAETDPARELQYGLDELIDPAPAVLATVEEFTVTVDGAEVAGIDATSIVENAEGDGFTFAGDVDLSGLTGEIDVILKMDTDADPATAAEEFKLSDTYSVEQRTVTDGDMFLFDFDQVFV